MAICPFMSRPAMPPSEGVTHFGHLLKVECQKGDCQAWKTSATGGFCKLIEWPGPSQVI